MIHAATRRPARRAAIGLAAVLAAGCFAAGPFRWKTFTATRQFRDLAAADSAVWGATEGGLVRFDAGSGAFRTWTNTEGLASNALTAIALDGTGRLWIGSENGALQSVDPSGGPAEWFGDFKGHPISSLLSSGDSLFVGLDIGVSLFRPSRKEVRETYKRLGASLPVETPVNGVAVAEGRLWAATNEGLAHAPLSGENLLDPGFWTDETFGTAYRKIFCLRVLEGRLHLGSAGAVFRRREGGWETLSSGLPGEPVRDLAFFDGALAAVVSSGLFRWDGAAWRAAASGAENGLSLLAEAGRLFAGTSEGLAVLERGSSAATRRSPDGPASSRAVDLAVDRRGMLWGASEFYRGSGFFGFDGSHWTRVSRADHPDLLSNDFGCVAVDGLDRKWFGSWGNGVVVLENDGALTPYNARNGFLSTSTSADPVYAAVFDIVSDRAGAVWILNVDALTGTPLVSATGDTAWAYYGAADGITRSNLRTAAVDSLGRKWIGTLENGVFVLDDAGTAWDKTDDPDVTRVTRADGLASDAIRALAVDRDGQVWIGTAEGLYYYSYGTLGQIPSYYQDPVTALAVDGVNNVWVGTEIGLGYFSARTLEAVHFTVDNSPLVSNRVTALAHDPSSGVVWAATDAGLSRIETPFSRTLSSLGSVRVYPNPFRPGRHAHAAIDGLTRNAAVTIFTMSGLPVRRFPAGGPYGRALQWDGRDDGGAFAASGLYVVVVQAEDGQRALGKLAVIR